jgi:hypothetical protein
MFNEESLLKLLNERIVQLSQAVEKTRIADYISLMENPKKIIYTNFLAGIARGFGMAIGFTLLGALVIYILRALLIFNLPLIGGLIAEIVRIVQQQM